MRNHSEFCLFLRDKVSCEVARSSLKLAVLLPQSPKCWDLGFQSCTGTLGYGSFFTTFLLEKYKATRNPGICGHHQEQTEKSELPSVMLPLCSLPLPGLTPPRESACLCNDRCREDRKEARRKGNELTVGSSASTCFVNAVFLRIPAQAVSPGLCILRLQFLRHGWLWGDHYIGYLFWNGLTYPVTVLYSFGKHFCAIETHVYSCSILTHMPAQHPSLGLSLRTLILEA